MSTLSAEALALFLAYAKDACNWSGCPCVGGNVTMDQAAKGYLTALKKEGLLFTELDEGCAWIHFTPAGKALAAEHGVEL